MDKKIIMIILFSVGIIMSFIGGINLGKSSIESELIDLKEKISILQFENNGTRNELILADTQIMNLDPYAYLYCTQHEKIDNVTISVNVSRSSFPVNNYFYGDKKFGCFMNAQIQNDTELRAFQNIKISDNLTNMK